MRKQTRTPGARRKEALPGCASNRAPIATFDNCFQNNHPDPASKKPSQAGRGQPCASRRSRPHRERLLTVSEPARRRRAASDINDPILIKGEISTQTTIEAEIRGSKTTPLQAGHPTDAQRAGTARRRRRPQRRDRRRHRADLTAGTLSRADATDWSPRSELKHDHVEPELPQRRVAARTWPTPPRCFPARCPSPTRRRSWSRSTPSPSTCDDSCSCTRPQHTMSPNPYPDDSYAR